MQLYAKCMCCMINQQERQIRKFDDEERKAAFIKEIMTLTGSCGPEYSAPWILALMTEIREKYFGKDEEMPRKKREFNQFLLDLEDELAQMIQESGDALKEAMRFARIGNYIDFGAMHKVEKKVFLELFQDKRKNDLDKAVYQSFLQDCESGRRFLLLADNCGEIVLDKLFLKELKKRFPHLELCVMVRGEEVLNDATLEDAETVGLHNVARVIPNGNGVGGTVENMLQGEAKEVLEQADIILSKGQANFETLNGCGRNIYYSFLCKCDWFSGRFQVERNTGMFLREREILP